MALALLLDWRGPRPQPPHFLGRLLGANAMSLRAAGAQQLCFTKPHEHHSPALLRWCNALVHEGSWWALWWGSLDGMQGVRGSNPLSSTTT
jgi:hypothetical protein